ncbi:related to multidrug transporter [Rhynchosporium agropyri]|uniref:Related to multidrug transporter n=1 Tax=Rhynchosporium agropyri TaxID=914238 RepID=A0A1E1LQS8_9HELO|nr:related to multidrug transporter [Rhynchosporium agropyri]
MKLEKPTEPSVRDCGIPEKSSVGKNEAIRDTEAGIHPSEPLINPHDTNLPKFQLISLLICLCFGLFLSLLDTTIVATAIYTIGVDLSALTTINWVALAYTLSYLGCAVIFARLADIIGRRNAYVSAFIMFVAFSVGCGFAQTLNQLIAMRVLQGIGGSGLYSLTFVIMPEISPVKIQPLTGALAGAVVAMAGVLGPVLGGVITNYTTWRWVFWINAPIGIIPLVVFMIAWPSSDRMTTVHLRPLKELDFFGAIIVIAASVLLVFSFQQAGLNANSWSQAIFIAPFIIGILLWIVLFGWESLVAKKWEGSIATMFPLRLLKRRVFMGHFITTLLAGFPYFMVIFALPLRLQVVNGKSQLVSGVALLPTLAAVAITSSIGGMMNSKRDLIWPTLLAGSLFMVIGCACLSTLDNVPQIQAKMYGFQVFVGLGFGLMVSTVSMGASLECELRDRTVAQGIIAQARVLGGSIGIAASTAILSKMRHRYLSNILTTPQLLNLEASSRSLTPAQHLAVQTAYSTSFSESMKVCAAVSGACVLATLITFRRTPMVIMERRDEQAREYTELLIREERERAEKTAQKQARSSGSSREL